MNTEEVVGQNFNRRAATYAQSAGVQLRFAEWLGEWIERGLPDSVRMWELGAGTGFFTRQFSRCGYRVLATDIAPEMVTRGRLECPDADWVIHDSWRLPERICDRLFSSSLLQWMPNPEENLRVFYNALRAGGKMLHGFFVAPSLQELYSLVEPAFLPLQWRSEQDWCDDFQKAGFKILRVESQETRARYKSAADFLRGLRDSGVAPPGTGVSAGTLRRVLREYEDKFGDGRGGVFATWRFFRIESTRE